MCTYITESTPVRGSGKGARGWFALTHAMASVDHPYHAPFEHTLNLDFYSETEGPSARVAVELTPDSARALVARIEAALQQAQAVI